MYVNVNGKVIEVTEEEYNALVGVQDSSSNYKPVSKMEELINAVKSIADAISNSNLNNNTTDTNNNSTDSNELNENG